MVALIALAIGLAIGGPENWTWDNICGPYVVEAINWLTNLRPLSIIILLALALALFMTRLRY